MIFLSKYEKRILAGFCLVMVCGLALKPFERRDAGFLRFIADLEQRDFHPVFNLNTVTFDDLEEVSGIGRGKAERMIRHRLKYGLYENVSQLADVQGLDGQSASKIQKYFYVTR